MFAILSGLLCSFLYATSDMFSQRVARETRPLTQVVWVLAAGGVLMVPMAFALKGLPSASEWRGVALAALAGVFYFIAALCLFQGLRVGDLSLVAALTALQGAYVAVAVVALGAPITALLGIGLAFCILGAVFTSFEDRARSTKGAAWAFAAGALFAGALLCYAYSELDWLSQAAVSRVVSLAIAVPVALAWGGIAVPAALRVRAVGAGWLEVCGLLLLTIAFSLGPPTIAGVTTSQYGTFAVLLGFALLGERPKPHQWVGVACTIAGVSLLAALV